MELQKQQILQVKNFISENCESKTVGDRASEVGVSTAIGVGAILLHHQLVRQWEQVSEQLHLKNLYLYLPTITKDVYETITKSKYPLTKVKQQPNLFKKVKGCSSTSI